MIDIDPIADAHEYVSNLFREDPARARNTATTTVQVDDKLTCKIEEGPWQLVADLSPKAGGGGEGPTPGVLGRAAFGSCIAVGFVLEAAKAGVPIRSVRIEVEADYDDGALFGTSDARPGYGEVRYRIVVDSDADAAELAAVGASAQARSPYIDIFSNTTPVVGEVMVRGGD